MKVLVYFDYRREQARAGAIAESIRDDDHEVGLRFSKYFDPEQIEPADAVVVMDPDSAVADAYRSIGTDVQPADPEDTRGVDPVAPVEPEGADGEPRAESYTIDDSSPGWYKVVGPDGEQVGKSHRKREDAEAAIAELGG